jgi:multidrug efflux pump subunit AcrA (membrane-fusion protein)
LRGAGVVAEPHSFDVKVRASQGGQSHQWTYQSYEGRTTISAQAAQAGGVKTEIASAANVAQLVDMAGRVEITPEGKGEVRAWYHGRVMALRGALGTQVRKGQLLARVESSESLQTYSIFAPISGIIVEKNLNVGDVAGERAIFVIADPTKTAAGTRGAKGIRREGSHQSRARVTRMAIAREITRSRPKETETPGRSIAGRRGSTQERTKLKPMKRMLLIH